MAAELRSEILNSDNWLSGLVEVMDDLSSADAICREANPVIIARLFEQLQSRQPAGESRSFS